MKSLAVRWRASALDDLREIIDWIASESGSFDIAQKYVDRIFDLGDSLGAFPEKGRARDDLADGIRILPHARSIVIAYRIRGAYVEVTNVFYGRRDFESLLRDSQPDKN